MRSRLIALLALSALGCSIAQARPKKLEVAPAFQTAHTVYVESVDGEASRPGVSPADREAIQIVQEAVREWNRYTLVESRANADLVIVIRKGHAVGDQDHLGLGQHPRLPEPPPMRPGMQSTGMAAHPIDQNASVGTGGDDIASQDLLRVYTVSEKGKLKGPLWARELDAGLDGPSVRLLQELKAAVEITYPSQPAAPAQAATQPGP